jgi:hypothetical protein
LPLPFGPITALKLYDFFVLVIVENRLKIDAKIKKKAAYLVKWTEYVLAIVGLEVLYFEIVDDESHLERFNYWFQKKNKKI